MSHTLAMTAAQFVCVGCVRHSEYKTSLPRSHGDAEHDFSMSAALGSMRGLTFELRGRRRPAGPEGTGKRRLPAVPLERKVGRGMGKEAASCSWDERAADGRTGASFTGP